MPNLRDFERRLGGLVEGLFSKTFRSGLQPVEIAKRIVRTMDESKQVGVNEIWAPNRFEVSLSEDDAPRFTPIETPLVTELARLVRDTAAERGWGLVGPPQIELYVDEQLRRGDLDVEASLVEGEDAVAPVASSSSRLLVHDGATVREVPLAAGATVTIGRLPENDVVLDDRGASRRHAQVRLDAGEAVLTDLGSTNGTQLNGRQVQTRALADGDKIVIGTTLIEYRGS